MRVLLDTHALLWAILEPAKLSRTVAGMIADHANEVLLSAASGWEIATKVRRGKLPEAAPLERKSLEVVKSQAIPYSRSTRKSRCGLGVCRANMAIRLIA